MRVGYPTASGGTRLADAFFSQASGKTTCALSGHWTASSDNPEGGEGGEMYVWNPEPGSPAFLSFPHAEVFGENSVGRGVDKHKVF